MYYVLKDFIQNVRGQHNRKCVLYFTNSQTRPILFYERLIEQYNLTPHGVVNSQLLIWALD